MSSQKNAVADEFIEKFGLLVQEEGLPRIAGRILGALIIFDEPHSFSQLSEKLEVSRASISTNTRLLANLGLIERTTKRGERQDYFALKHNPYTSLIKGVETRSKRTCELIENTSKSLPNNATGAKQRLAEMRQFYEKLNQAFKSLT